MAAENSVLNPLRTEREREDAGYPCITLKLVACEISRVMLSWGKGLGGVEIPLLSTVIPYRRYGYVNCTFGDSDSTHRVSNVS